MKDVVVVGAGHNGLVSAAYLARAGLDVEVVERRPVIGGASATEELIPGYRASSCAFVVGLLRPEIIRDLELRRHGLELYQPPAVAGYQMTDDGRGFFTYRDVDRELRELREHFGPRAPEGYLAFGVAMQQVGNVLGPAFVSRPPSRETLQAALEATGGERLWERFFAGSVADLMDVFFDDDRLRGYMAFPAMVSIYGGPRTVGTSYVLTHHAVAEFNGMFGQWGFARGGLGAVAAAIAADARAHGVRIRTEAGVRRILVEDGQARGVVLDTGEEIRARQVLSNADPEGTLLRLVGADHLAPDVADALGRHDVSGSMARLHIATDVLPAFVGGPSRATVGPEHLGHNLLGASIERFERGWEAQRKGHLFDDPVVELLVESAREPGSAPAGHHLLLAGVQQLPRDLHDRTWDDARQDLIDTVLKQLYRYAPNLEGHVVATHALTPLDLEREYGLTGGNIYHGALTADQLFDQRPFGALSSYRTPIAGLYLCGSGVHPGGGVTGAAGHNAARTALSDLGSAHGWGGMSAGGNGAGARRPDALERLGQVMTSQPALRRLTAVAAQRRWLRPVLARATKRRSS